MGCCRAQVGADQGRLEVVEGIAVDLFTQRNYVFDALGKVLAGARDRFFHAIEKTWFLLLIETAEKGLNHKCFLNKVETFIIEAGRCGRRAVRVLMPILRYP